MRIAALSGVLTWLGIASGVLLLLFAIALAFNVTARLDEYQRAEGLDLRVDRFLNGVEYTLLLRFDQTIVDALIDDARSIQRGLADVPGSEALEATRHLEELSHILKRLAPGPYSTLVRSAIREHQASLRLSINAMFDNARSALLDTLIKAVAVGFSSALALAAICVLGFMRVRWRLDQPIARLSSVINRLGEGDLGARAAVDGDDELAQIGEDINRLADLRQAAEAQVKRSEERFRQLTENIREVFWLSDVGKTEMFYVSPSYETIWGLPPQQLYDRPAAWLDAIHPADRDRVVTSAQRQADGFYEELYRIRRPDDEERWILDRAFPVHDQSGKVIRIAGIAEDVTARVNTERALTERMKELGCLYRVLELTTDYGRESGEILQDIVDNLPASMHHDEHAVARLTVDGAVSADRQWQEPRASIEKSIIVGGRQRGSVEVGYTSLDALDDPAAPFLIEEERLLESVAGHVARMLQEREIAERLKRTERVEVIGQFTGGIAHDFNNLLTVILGNAELLIEEFQDGTDQAASLQSILRAGGQGAKLISNLLAFARQQPLSPGSVDLKLLLQNMTRMINVAVGENVTLHVVTTDPLFPAKADPAQLESAIINLLINARDAMEGGGEIRLTVSSHNVDREEAERSEHLQPGDYVRVEVRDNGCGIGKDALARVFEPFYTTKAPGKGTGLGLSMVYGFVVQLGGDVRIFSEPGHGTRVTLFLPKGDAPDAHPAPESNRDPVITGQSALVVEDDDMLRRFVKVQLERLGCEVFEAADGHEALRIFGEEQNISVLVTDYSMPGGMDGLQLAERCLSLRPRIGAVCTSGDADLIERLGEQVASRVISLDKPFSGKALGRAIAEACSHLQEEPV